MPAVLQSSSENATFVFYLLLPLLPLLSLYTIPAHDSLEYFTLLFNLFLCGVASQYALVSIRYIKAQHPPFPLFPRIPKYLMMRMVDMKTQSPTSVVKPEKEKRFECSHCQRRFARLEHLQRHERIRKPFPAPSPQ